MVKRIVQRIKLFSSNRKEFYLFLRNLFGFYPQNLKLYDLAFVHKSASKTDSQGNLVNNERLEYLGDAILGAIIADFLFNRFPQEDEGFLTKTRSKLVNRSFLTQLTFDMGLNVFIQANTTTKSIDKSHIYGDVLEALIGAIYLDHGYQKTKFFVTKKILSQFVNLNEIEQEDSNFKSQLIEWSQKNKHEIDFETTEKTDGKSRNPKFNTVIKIDNKEVGRGIGTSKKESHQNAAKATLNKLNKL